MMMTTVLYVFILTVFFVAATSGENSDYVFDGGLAPSYQDHKFDTMPPMPKRTALFLDRLMMVLQKAVKNNIMSEDADGSSYSRKFEPKEKLLDNPKRLIVKEKQFWPCYLNAVTCYKRK